MAKKILTAVAFLVVLLITACKYINPVETHTPTPIMEEHQKEEKETETKGEPTLQEEALKMDQFSLPKKDDVIAEIVIKEFGTIKIKLFPEKAPLAVENFIKHAKDGYYNGVIFHRVMEDFMIQGGDPTGTGFGGESIWGEYFSDEISSDLYPFRGALCMANNGKNTNSSQFFLVQEDADGVKELQYLLEESKNGTLKEYIKKNYGIELSDKLLENYMEYGGAPWLTGYHTVFGQIFDGFDVLDAVAKVPVNSASKPYQDIVIEEIVIYEFEEN